MHVPFKKKKKNKNKMASEDGKQVHRTHNSNIFRAKKWAKKKFSLRSDVKREGPKVNYCEWNEWSVEIF